ncbi:hypothetical protein WH47_10524 [Habropoda laboriosa]|uniref:Uncharacterized protein n=1 Tax=Habropoda laboriosa TaxID=597456 RepID=A0A0L7QMT7_9HYME|nr:hypothetical protein WH47_10524 [Habropoda laboriosa]
MFDYLIKVILLYKVELFRWKKRIEVRAVQVKYIKQCLGLDRCTPSYIVLQEMNRGKLRIQAGRRILNYEERIRTDGSSNLLKE